MVFKTFVLNVIFRVLLLSLTIITFFYLVFKTEYYTSCCLIGGLLALQIVFMIKYVARTNRYVTSFLEAIKYSEFTRSFEVEGLGTSFDKMNLAFNSVIKEFQKIRDEKEQQYFFLQNVIQHIGISMIAYHQDGSVEMYNNATKRLFRKSSLRNINDLSDSSQELVDCLFGLKTGERALIKINDDDDILQLTVYAKEFKIREQMLTLVSIQNIQNELEEKEMEAWQKLIRVLTHEIMNSITPIVSLTSTVNMMLDDTKESANEFSPELAETFEDIEQALKTINKRSTGLLHFVETYRNLTRIPKPDFSIFKINDFFANLTHLLEEDLRRGNVQLHVSVEPGNLELTADEELMEQVFINLIKNSIQALIETKKPVIKLKAFLTERGSVMLQVEDNGQGIIQEVLDKIFIPFFTTKPTGSGIGLSLSRQIVRIHGGTISARSIPGEQTTFIMRF